VNGEYREHEKSCQEDYCMTSRAETQLMEERMLQHRICNHGYMTGKQLQNDISKDSDRASEEREGVG
jgi:hypothetical protein